MNDKPTTKKRHPELLREIEEARKPMSYNGHPWTDDQLLAAAALACVMRGFHHLGTIRPFGAGVCTTVYPDFSTFDSDLLTRVVLTAHRFGVRITLTNGGPRRMKLEAFARLTSDNPQDGGLAFHERHPSLKTLEEACRKWALPGINQETI